MTMYVIILMLINSISTSDDNRNGLASYFKFGSVASFLTLSLLKRNFPEGLGGCLSNCGESGGMGGGIIAYLKKTENPGRRGVLSEIPSLVGVWIFSGTTHSASRTWPPN